MEFTVADWQVIECALFVAKQSFDKDSKSMAELGNKRMAKQFERQAKDVERVRLLVEEYML